MTDAVLRENGAALVPDLWQTCNRRSRLTEVSIRCRVLTL